MAKNRGIQTFEKRRRERDKQMKRDAKQAARLARKEQKRADGTSGPIVEEHPDRPSSQRPDLHPAPTPPTGTP